MKTVPHAETSCCKNTRRQTPDTECNVPSRKAFIVQPQRPLVFVPDSTDTVSHVEMEISSKRENRVRVPHPHIYNPLPLRHWQRTLPFPTPQLKPKPLQAETCKAWKWESKWYTVSIAVDSRVRGGKQIQNYFRLLWRSTRNWQYFDPLLPSFSNCYTKRDAQAILWLLILPCY